MAKQPTPEQLKYMFGGLVPPDVGSYEQWVDQFVAETAANPLPYSNADRLPKFVKWVIYKMILQDTEQVITYNEWSDFVATLGYQIKWPGCQKLVVAAWKWAGRTPEARKNSPVKAKRHGH